jgi:DNA-binding response OmpR family regulator
VPGMEPRVLVVEDEALLAFEMAHALENDGFEVVGPVRKVSSALELLRQHGCDAAVLDINLGDETSEAVALELTARSIPFLAVSSYSFLGRPPAFLNAPALAKPIAPVAIAAEVRKLVNAAA